MEIFGNLDDWVKTTNEVGRAALVVFIGAGFAGGIDIFIYILRDIGIISNVFVGDYLIFTLSVMITALFTAISAFFFKKMFLEIQIEHKKNEKKQLDK